MKHILTGMDLNYLNGLPKWTFRTCLCVLGYFSFLVERQGDLEYGQNVFSPRINGLKGTSRQKVGKPTFLAVAETLVISVYHEP